MGIEEKKRLSIREIIFVASLLFGMFFGAGNLIFPIHMGQIAGRNVFLASIGFILTGVGLPLLAVSSFGVSSSNDLYDLSSKVGKGYGKFFTTLLMLTIGPLFAIPRCATVSYTVGIEPMAKNIGGVNNFLLLLIFSLIFFAIVLCLSLKESELVKWIGKIINPLFLLFYVVLLFASIFKPVGLFSAIEPIDAYKTNSIFNGILEGYNTMDALAGLVFGIVVIDTIKGYGIKNEKVIMSNTIFAGIFACALMAIIYLLSSMMGANSRALFDVSGNGGIALSQISNYYFGSFGSILLACVITFACLKTSIGLVSSLSSTFEKLYPNFKLSRTNWVYIITIFSFLIANFGLNSIIQIAIPVLMFIYPLTITLILLAIFGNLFKHSKAVYFWVTIFTIIPALIDGVASLPTEFISFARMEGFISFAKNLLPFANIGFGWVIPALIGLIIGLIVNTTKREV